VAPGAWVEPAAAVPVASEPITGVDRRSQASALARAVSARFPVLPPPTALLEIAVLFGLIIGLGWLTGQDLADLRPHPFWVPVLLLSLQYGTVSGLLAAGIATAITGLGQLPEQVVGETYFVYFLRIWIEPILWISSAVLLGQFRMRQIANKMELVRQVQELAAQRTSLADYAGKLRRRCESLERRLAGRQEPDSLLMLQAIGRARTAGAAGLSAAFSHVMGAVLPGCQASLYLCDQSQLRRVLTAPLSGDRGHGEASAVHGLDAAHPLFQAVIVRGEGATVLTSAGEAALAGQGMAAVPIRADEGAIIGMIKVELIDSHLLGASTLGVLDTVADALARPLQAAVHAQELRLALDNGGDMGWMPSNQPAPLNSAAATVAQPGGKIWRHVARRMPAGLMGRR
jgi:polysaccharide biosynthesis protein PelD